MSGWIKLEKDLLTDPRVLKMARALVADPSRGVTRDSHAVTIVIGGLAQLWLLADSHIGEDDVLRYGVDDIDQLVGIPGFCQLVHADWLQVLDANSVKLPTYQAHNGTTAKRRAADAERQRAHRASLSQNVTSDNRDGHKVSRPRLDQNTKRKSRAHPVNGARSPEETAAWAKLLERAEACGFRSPHLADNLSTYECALRLRERDHDYERAQAAARARTGAKP